MSVVAELTIPSHEFALGETLRAVPTVSVEFERVVTHSQETVMPFLWAAGGDLAAFEREIARDPTVEEARVFDRFDRVELYHVSWNETIAEMINFVFDGSGGLVEAIGEGAAWEVVVRFDDHRSLADLQSYFTEGDDSFRLKRLYRPSTTRRIKFDLTQAQRDTLILAVEQGYFDVPRETSLSELADELDVSPTAVSERLRRGTETLVGDVLTVGSSDDNWTHVRSHV